MTVIPEFGLLLLTGGEGRRLGGRKQDRPHPAGGSWSAHLVRVFLACAPAGPVVVLGHPVADLPDLIVQPDGGRGPAAALVQWARSEALPARRWWTVACDQVQWTPDLLAQWMGLAAATDPEAAQWVVAEAQGHRQPLGGFLAHGLRGALASLTCSRVNELIDALPFTLLAWDSPAWADIDTPEAESLWRAQGKPAAR